MAMRVEDRTLKELTPNVAALLCYVGGWISGIVFLVMEQKNRFVRFHALQSIIVFGTLTLAGAILGSIPIIGAGFHWIIFVAAFVLWLILMLKAYAGESYKMPWAGDLAERLTNQSMGQFTQQNVRTEEPAEYSSPVTPPAAAPVVPAARRAKGDDFRASYYSMNARAGRITGSAFAIAWSVVLIIFFNFYNQYIAYYEPIYSGNTTHWQIYTLVTSGIAAWLPILTLTLVLSIVGHSLMIAFDKYILQQIVHIILAVFSLVTVVSLLVIFPFNFSVLPNAVATSWAVIGVTCMLIFIAVGIGIGALVRFIKLIVQIAEGEY